VTFLITVTKILLYTVGKQNQIRKSDRKNTFSQTKSQFVYKYTSRVTKAAGLEVFFMIPTNASALLGTNQGLRIDSRVLLNCAVNNLCNHSWYYL